MRPDPIYHQTGGKIPAAFPEAQLCWVGWRPALLGRCFQNSSTCSRAYSTPACQAGARGTCKLPHRYLKLGRTHPSFLFFTYHDALPASSPDPMLTSPSASPSHQHHLAHSHSPQATAIPFSPMSPHCPQSATLLFLHLSRLHTEGSEKQKPRAVLLPLHMLPCRLYGHLLHILVSFQARTTV